MDNFGNCYDQLNFRLKKYAALEGKPGMVFVPRWSCFAEAVLASLAAAVVPLDMPGIRRGDLKSSFV